MLIAILKFAVTAIDVIAIVGTVTSAKKLLSLWAKRRRCNASATATVTNVHPGPRGPCYVAYEYVADEERVHVSQDANHTNHTFHAGETFEVLYDPKEPRTRFIPLIGIPSVSSPKYLKSILVLYVIILLLSILLFHYI